MRRYRFYFTIFKSLKIIDSLLAKNYSFSFLQRAVMLLGIFLTTIYFSKNPLFIRLIFQLHDGRNLE